MLFAMSAPAGAVSVRWTRDAGTSANGGARQNGALYVAGVRPDGMTSAATLIRYGSDGTRLWTRSWLPSKDASTAGVTVATGPNGSIYLLGTVHGQCEGGGWFIRAYASDGALRGSYVTPGWRSCSLAETPFDIAATSRLVVVVGMDNGCCGDPMQDGWVRSFTPTLAPSWTTPFEPPAGLPLFLPPAPRAAIYNGSVFVAGWAATSAVPSGSEGMMTPGTVILEKLTPGGCRGADGRGCRCRGYPASYRWRRTGS